MPHQARSQSRHTAADQRTHSTVAPSAPVMASHCWRTTGRRLARMLMICALIEMSSSSVLPEPPAHQVDAPPAAQIAILHRGGERQGFAIHPFDVGGAEMVGDQRLADQAQVRRAAMLMDDPAQYDFVRAQRLADDLPSLRRRSLRATRHVIEDAQPQAEGMTINR